MEFYAKMTFKSEIIGIVGHFQERVGKSRSKLKKKVGKSRKNRKVWLA